MEPIANETWKSFQRSYYRARLLMLLASLGEAYVGQLARMMRIKHSRVLALLEGDPKEGYAKELSLVFLGLAEEKGTATGRAYAITNKGLRKSRSIASARRPPEPTAPPQSLRATTSGMNAEWSVGFAGRADGASAVFWHGPG